MMKNLKNKEKKGNNNTKLEKSKGITLIALVITIIVLLILAGITIVTLTGDNGILTKASEAKEKTEEANAEEQVQVAVIGSIEADGKINLDELNNELKKIDDLTYNGSPISDSNKIESLPATVNIGGYDVKIEENGEFSTLPSTENTNPFLPDGAEVIENDLSKGVVIKDSNENEWTWIEVPKSIYINSEYNEGTAPVSSEDYGKIESILQNYVKDYRESDYKDTWYSEEQHGFASAEEYNNHKNAMLKSVYENGGFYIGRYEAGTETLRNTADDPLTLVVVKEGAYPYNYITNKQAQEKSEELATGGRTSSLMFGIQWDLVLKYIETKSEKTQADLKDNSITWGNYGNATFDITRGKYSEDNGDSFTDVSEKYTKAKYEFIMLTTGATERKSVLNIYDLAGNLNEWTLEQYTIRSNIHPCTYRGGYYFNDSSNEPASGRKFNTTSVRDKMYGFRPALW